MSDKKDLIIIALRQKLGDLEFENADVRAEYTLLAEELQRVTEEYDKLVMENTAGDSE